MKRVKRGYVDVASPDINLIPREPNYVGTATRPVHSGPWDYLARVPLVIYGPGYVEAGKYSGVTTMADVAPTTAALIGFDGFEAPDGTVLEQALAGSGSVPRLVVTLVWDGGGLNVLSRHERSHPFLDKLMKRSAVFSGMEIGSSPSVTPPIHTTLSTGAFPRRHGIPGLRIRTETGEHIDPFHDLDPSNIRVPTLADVYDAANGNRPVTGMLASANWHLSMIGHGDLYPGGDADPVVLFENEGRTFTNRGIYYVPAIEDVSVLLEEAEKLDAADGSRDGEWRGHDLADPAIRYASPAHIRYEQFLLARLIETAAFGNDDIPDLLYVNFKSADDAGHAWGMTSQGTAGAIRALDDELRRLVHFLDRTVGEGLWALILTADHGQTPFPEESGAWPIGGGELASDMNAEFDLTDDDVDLVDRVSSPGAYVNRSQLEASTVSLDDLARFAAGYTVEQNLRKDQELPEEFAERRDELLFDAVVLEDRKMFSEAC